MAIVKRVDKGTELTHAEMDNNLSELDDRSLTSWSEDIDGNLVPSSAETISIGSPSRKVKDLYISNNSV